MAYIIFSTCKYWKLKTCEEIWLSLIILLLRKVLNIKFVRDLWSKQSKRLPSPSLLFFSLFLSNVYILNSKNNLDEIIINSISEQCNKITFHICYKKCAYCNILSQLKTYILPFVAYFFYFSIDFLYNHFVSLTSKSLKSHSYCTERQIQ